MDLRSPVWRLAAVVSIAASLALVLPAATLLVTIGGSEPPWDPFPNGPNETWLSIHPVQCLGNEWEQDWVRENNGTHFYPEEWEDQRRIIVDYYARIGVDVLEVRRETPGNVVVCAACSCWAGYILYLLVPDEDVDLMRARGYQVVP